ncbi:chloramphenicol phosphotransferase CPT family protein [Maritalea sp.]|uniref:chloramphenicol phosphotransferase CPT family protein n=1 Tax=Maritalea sp. TaxID=2003361 RepID=UPI003EF8C240
MTLPTAEKLGKIIFLHGASSSGKSTLARQLQSIIEEPFWHISIDHLRDAGVLPSERIANGDFNWSLMRKNFFNGYHNSLAAYARAGNNLILEHILDTKGWIEELTVLFEPFDVFFVGIHCPLDELRKREMARGNREIGSAAKDFENIHEGLTYHLEIDTNLGVDENAKRLLQKWRERQVPSIFDPMKR